MEYLLGHLFDGMYRCYCGGGGGSGDLDFVASVELWVRKVGIDGRVDVQYHVESRAAYLWHFCSVYILL